MRKPPPQILPPYLKRAVLILLVCCLSLLNGYSQITWTTTGVSSTWNNPAAWSYTGSPVGTYPGQNAADISNVTILNFIQLTQDVPNPVNNIIVNQTLSMQGHNLEATGNISGNNPINTGVGGILTIGGSNNTHNNTIMGTGTVHFNGTGAQSIKGITYNNLTFSNVGTKTLTGIATVSNVLTMDGGNIVTGSNRLTMNSTLNTDLVYNSGGIIGHFRRSLATPGVDYKFPVGTGSELNMVTLNFSSAPAGNITIEFVEADPSGTGFPFPDGAATINDDFSDGYWQITAGSGFNGVDFDLTLRAEGFIEYSINSVTRVIERTSGDWSTSGTHVDASDPEIYRNGISISASETKDYGLGFACEETFTEQPASVSSCAGEDVTFQVSVAGSTGHQWKKDGINIPGETSNTLVLTSVGASDEGSYRCEVTTACGVVLSNAASLALSDPFAG
jgi:hypothetical protein